MQNKKYISLFLGLSFFLSTTGIPVMMHLCFSMKEVSFKSCAMCSNSDTNDHNVKFKSKDCCGTKVVASPSSAQYLASKHNDNEILTISDVITLQNDVDYAANTNNILQNGNLINSPPPGDTPPLFISNLSLLI